jgi:hypothetical protein
MTSSSVACRSREGALVRDLRTPGTAEGRSGTAELPKTDKG